MTVYLKVGEQRSKLLAEAQPVAELSLLTLLEQLIALAASRIPAWERSIEEVRLEFDLL
ncbi:MAG: hypothetical protein HC810_00810 [Acaryochloridaceae cyanobacterium RL_2_7]|nr:hypothetical protein [Acaryochloridaceae cyanobacterium RL_2_7]